MNKLPLAARAVWLVLALALAGASTGCKVPASLTKPSEEEQREIDRKRELPTEVACLVVEYDYLHAEVGNPRKEPFDRVAFDYVASEALPAAVAKGAPTHVFVIAHGWMNNAISAQGFTSAWIHGLRAQAPAGSRPVFVGVHWDSERLVFHESAFTAQRIGRKRIGPLLAQLRAKLPATTKLIVIGHSLGGRLMLAALDAAPAESVDLALLIESAADVDWLYKAEGGTPKADDAAKLTLNVHSRNDSVLELAYKNAMRSPALGRLGAELAAGQRFSTLELSGAVQIGALDVALKAAASRADGRGHFVNVDATQLIPGHTDIFHDPVFSLVWLGLQRAQ